MTKSQGSSRPATCSSEKTCQPVAISAAWTEAKLGRPRHFTYWREPAVQAALMATGWQVLSLEHVAGRADPWLFVIARTGQVPSKIARRPV